MKLSRSYQKFSPGLALIAVIWLIAILSIAAVATLQIVSLDMRFAATKIHGARARQLADMGAAIAENPMVKRDDPLLHYMNEQTGEGYDVRLSSEGKRLNLNTIILREDKSLLRQLFSDWGLTLEESQAVADALCDWVDGDDDVALNGAESDWYRKQGRSNQPFNRPFYDLAEAKLVRGMDLVAEKRPDWQDSFTIWSSGQLDINEAPAELIAAAAEVPLQVARVVENEILGPDGHRDTEDDAPFPDLLSALSMLGVDAESRADIVARFTVNEATSHIESIGFAAGAKYEIDVTLRNRTGIPALLQRTERILSNE